MFGIDGIFRRRFGRDSLVNPIALVSEKNGIVHVIDGDQIKTFENDILIRTIGGKVRVDIDISILNFII